MNRPHPRRVRQSSRDIAAGDRAMRAGVEGWGHAGNIGIFTLYGKPVGFIGFGSLAQSLLWDIGRMVIDHLESIVRGLPPRRLEAATPELALRYARAVRG